VADTLIVALNGVDVSDNILGVMPRFSVSETEVIVHYSPVYDVATGDKNFDILIDMQDYHSSPYFKYLSHENFYFSNPRYSKTEQAIKIARASKGLESFKNVKTYLTLRNGPAPEGKRIYEVSTTPSSPNGMVVVKLEDGARGLGQVVIPAFQLQRFLALAGDAKDSKELREWFPDIILGRLENEKKLGNLFGKYSVMVCEYVDNITQEYRILFNGFDFKGYWRTRNDNEYSQANIDLSNHKKEIVPDFIEHDIPEVATDVTNVINKLGMRFGSIDLFLTSDGKWGIFEYCNQWGTYNINFNRVIDFNTGIIRNIVDEYLNAGESK